MNYDNTELRVFFIQHIILYEFMLEMHIMNLKTQSLQENK